MAGNFFAKKILTKLIIRICKKNKKLKKKFYSTTNLVVD